MKTYIFILALLLISLRTTGQTIQNGQDGSNFTTINQISANSEIAQADQSINHNTLIKTYHDEIWVIEFTSDSTFVISDSIADLSEFEGRDIAVPKEIIAKAALKGLMDLLLYTEFQIGNKSGISEYKLLEDMVSSEYDLGSTEQEFYKELDNMVSGILVNVIMKENIDPGILFQERSEALGIPNPQDRIVPTDQNIQVLAPVVPR
ncbi:MAG: hypothetical protein U9R60_18955 [Bacteroidota bacterium]|nr:hypothetical protein [Bacteroidota bacterium]